MASLTRPTKATYISHEDVTVDTADHRDHTFCGVMFPVRIKQDFPIDRVLFQSFSVRGRLGPITVWVDGSNNHDNQEENRKYEQVQRYGQTWNKIYQHTHSPSPHRFTELKFPSPLILKPGEIRTFYIHSSDRSDQSIVYDNARNRPLIFEDGVLVIDVGRAHLSTAPFGDTNIWGYPGAWRDGRAFVGQISYGIIYKLWNPQIHTDFGNSFDQMVLTLLLCQRRYESHISLLPDDCLYYILNMCGYSWAAPYCKKKKGIFPDRKRYSKRILSLKERIKEKKNPKRTLLRKLFSPISWGKAF